MNISANLLEKLQLDQAHQNARWSRIPQKLHVKFSFIIKTHIEMQSS